MEILKKSDKALSVYEIEDELGYSSVDELKELLKVLNELEEQYQIYRTKKDKYMLFNNSNLKVGKLMSTKKGYGFVDIEGDEDVFVSQDNLNGAINADQVVVEITSKKGLKLEGRILKVIERKLKQFVGKVYFKDNKCKIDLDDKKVNLDIIIDEDKTLGAVSGHKVLVRLLNKINNTTYKGAIIKILGHQDDPGVDILSIAAKYEIEEEFPEEVIEQLKNIPNAVLESEMVGRIDLRDKEIITIDCDNTKDRDDAVYVEKLDNGNYKLITSIASINYYVKKGSKLFEEALERNTSHYPNNTCIPMFPKRISNGICSLNEKVDRLTKSCEMEINSNGEVVDYKIYNSVIKSRKAMKYSEVNEVLNGNNIDSYEEFRNQLILMDELSTILEKAKIKRDYMNFDIPDIEIIQDENGKPLNFKESKQGKAEKLIENFMLITNTTVAENYSWFPFIYRIHETPDEETVKGFIDLLNSAGFNIPKVNNINERTIKGILGKTKCSDKMNIIRTTLLKSMKRARYDTNNIGHFGLASRNYTHFTSPIRRFPDLTVHRLLRKYLFESQMGYELIDYYERTLPGVAKHSSEREKASVDCERAVNDMKMAEYMMDHIGEEFTGMIDTVTNYGMYVMLPNLVEGLVRLEDIGDDYYYYDETTFSIVGRKSKKRYRLGDNVKVVATEAIKEKGQINFKLANENAKEEKHGNPKQAG